MQYIVLVLDNEWIDRDLVQEAMNLCADPDDFEETMQAASEAVDALDLIWLATGADA